MKRSMKIFTLMQAGALVVLAVYGAHASQKPAQPGCAAAKVTEVCKL